MRGLVAVVVAGSLMATGCVANSYQIPNSELQRLAATPPEARGQKVRVIQELGASDVPPAQPVDANTQIVIVPQINVGIGPDHRSRPVGSGGSVGSGRIGSSGGGKGGGLHLGGGGGDGKAAAVVLLVIAAVALVAIAGVEGSRFDGWAQLHPMHPVHLIGRDGGYTVMPLAWIDPATAAWTRKAVVRPSEGPWRQLERAPLDRTGPTLSMFAGSGSLRSAYGDLALGPAFTVQLGIFPTQQIGLVGSVFFGWRDNRAHETLFESRYTLELQALPVAAGPFHAGLFGGAGGAHRSEDGVANGRSSTGAFTGGAMFQLDVNTRIALTARFGLAKAHEEAMRDILVGMAVY
ncbi:MAG TPA: hypothetical protein VN253_09360 [Kofleriaceae bacterium]|nr:hypothetical protein [Kofleriaceae bacterium]